MLVYFSLSFTNFINENDIIHQFSYAYTRQLNGVIRLEKLSFA